MHHPRTCNFGNVSGAAQGTAVQVVRRVDVWLTGLLIGSTSKASECLPRHLKALKVKGEMIGIYFSQTVRLPTKFHHLLIQIIPTSVSGSPGNEDGPQVFIDAIPMKIPFFAG